MWVENVVRPLAEVEPYRGVGSEPTGSRYQDLEQVWTTPDRQKHFAPERFEPGNRGREKMLPRRGLEQDVFWTQAQGVTPGALASTLQSGPGGRWQRKAACRINEL